MGLGWVSGFARAVAWGSIGKISAQNVDAPRTVPDTPETNRPFQHLFNCQRVPAERCSISSTTLSTTSTCRLSTEGTSRSASTTTGYDNNDVAAEGAFCLHRNDFWKMTALWTGAVMLLHTLGGKQLVNGWRSWRGCKHFATSGVNMIMFWGRDCLIGSLDISSHMTSSPGTKACRKRRRRFGPAY